MASAENLTATLYRMTSADHRRLTKHEKPGCHKFTNTMGKHFILTSSSSSGSKKVAVAIFFDDVSVLIFVQPIHQLTGKTTALRIKMVICMMCGTHLRPM